MASAKLHSCASKLGCVPFKNRAATPLLDEAVSGDPDIYPGPELRARLFAEQALPLREMRQRTRLWTAFRTQY